MSNLKFGAALATALLLAGCFVSDEPMFRPADASAAPLQPGRYEACNVPLQGEDDDCQQMDVAWPGDGSYRLQIVDEDPVVARFHEIDATGYAVQIENEDGDGYQYYWARREANGILLAMIWCDELDAAMRDKMKADGLITKEEGSSTCTVLKRDAIIIAAKAYADGAVTGESAVRLTRAQ